MSITIVFEKLGTDAVADVDLVRLNAGYISFVSSTMSQDGRRNEAVYRYATGDPKYPLTIYITQRFDPAGFGGKGSLVTTWRLAGIHTSTDSVTGEVITSPFEGGIWFTVQGKYILDAVEIRQLLNNVFTLTFVNVTAGVIDNTMVEALANGLVTLFT
jgi:hypothetical protein